MTQCGIIVIIIRIIQICRLSKISVIRIFVLNMNTYFNPESIYFVKGHPPQLSFVLRHFL